MVPRNHTVTVLMLVPKEQFEIRCYGGPPAIRTVMRSVLRDAGSGELLPFDRKMLYATMHRALIDARIDEDRASWLTTTKDGNHVLNLLVSYVQQQRRTAFDSELRKWGLAPYRDGLWVALAEFDTRTPLQSALITLCEPIATGKRPTEISCVPVPKKKEDNKNQKKEDAKGKTTTSGTTITTTITTTTTPPAKN